MRTLTDTLTAAQKITGFKPLAKVVLTIGAVEYTYTKTDILSIIHRQEPYSHKAFIAFNDRANLFAALELAGAKVVISKGASTSAGDEYSASAPLWVIPHQFDSAEGRVTRSIAAVGIPDLLDEDRAQGIYVPSLTETVKDLVQSVLAATNTVYSGMTAYTVSWDILDSLVDTFLPKQLLIISEGMSRLDFLIKALQYTKCMPLFQADGAVHIAVPNMHFCIGGSMTADGTTAGDVANLADGNAATGWENNAALPHWVKRDMGSGVTKIVTTYTLTADADEPTRAPKNWTLQGSNNDSDWTTLDTQTSQTFTASEKKWYYFTNTTGYRYYKLNITAVNDTIVRFSELEFYATKVAFDYEYSRASGYHPFLSKTYRQRIVIPNYQTVQSRVGESPQYTGYATDNSYTLLRKDGTPLRMTLETDAQATAIANCIIAKAQLKADGGALLARTNAGQEVLDYIQLTDSRQGDTRTGNVGYIEDRINFREARWEMTVGFGGWLAKQLVSRDFVLTAIGTQLSTAAGIDIATAGVTNVGDYLLHAKDDETTNLATSYTKYREVLIPFYGYLRIKFDLCAVEGPTYSTFGRLAKNTPSGSDPQTSSTWIGTERERANDGYATFSEDLSGFKPGDRLELWCKASAVTASNKQRYSRLYYDRTGLAGEPTMVDIV